MEEKSNMVIEPSFFWDSGGRLFVIQRVWNELIIDFSAFLFIYFFFILNSKNSQKERKKSYLEKFFKRMWKNNV